MNPSVYITFLFLLPLFGFAQVEMVELNSVEIVSHRRLIEPDSASNHSFNSQLPKCSQRFKAGFDERITSVEDLHRSEIQSAPQPMSPIRAVRRNETPMFRMDGATSLDSQTIVYTNYGRW